MDATAKERIAWMNRPPGEMILGLAEWLATRPGVGKGQQDGNVIVNPIIKLGNADGGRARHEPGHMNGLEKRYAAHLEMRRMTGEIVSWKFEPLKLKLAPSTFYSPDFLVEIEVGFEGGRQIELHETKGHWEDDARVKIKCAAVMFPMFTFIGVQRIGSKRVTGGDWKFEKFQS